MIDWLKHKNYWNLQELQTHIEEHYQVVFESDQSYYGLFAQAGISWKKTQRSNPKKDPELVKKNRTSWCGWNLTDVRENTIDFLKYLLAPLFRATHCCVLGRCMYTLDSHNLSFVKSLKP